MKLADENNREASRDCKLLWKEKKTTYRYTLNPTHYKNWRYYEK